VIVTESMGGKGMPKKERSNIMLTSANSFAIKLTFYF
jgi:hypothetical protein